MTDSDDGEICHFCDDEATERITPTIGDSALSSIAVCDDCRERVTV